MFLSVQLWYHIAAHRTGFQDEELSIEDANHVAFKKLSQRPHDRAVKESMTNSLLQITAPAALWRNSLLRWKQFLADPEGIPNDQPGEGSLVVIETPHPGGPRPQQATLRLRHTELANQTIASAPPWLNNDIMPYLTVAGCQRDLSAAERELSMHAGTRVWANGGPPRQQNAHFLAMGKIV